MIEDDLDAVLASLDAALDPDALAADVLQTTGEALVQYDRQHAPYEDRTGTLRSGYRIELAADANQHTLDEINETPYAPYVDAKGFSVMPAWDGGAVERILHAAFRQHERTGDL